jgi:hypothetical protein
MEAQLMAWVNSLEDFYEIVKPLVPAQRKSKCALGDWNTKVDQKSLLEYFSAS